MSLNRHVKTIVYQGNKIATRNISFCKYLKHAEPYGYFNEWYSDAENSEIKFPNAMFLATSNSMGYLSGRIVALKRFDKGGFLFLANKDSRKVNHMLENGNVAAAFHWGTLDRLVRIEGTVHAVSDEQKVQWFTPPFNACEKIKVAPCATREYVKEEHLKDLIGYRITPYVIEFQQGVRKWPALPIDRIIFLRQSKLDRKTIGTRGTGQDEWYYELCPVIDSPCPESPIAECLIPS